MRITFLQLLIVFSFFGSTWGKDAKAQAILNRKISINQTNTEMSTVLKRLETDYDINFVIIKGRQRQKLPIGANPQYNQKRRKTLLLGSKRDQV